MNRNYIIFLLFLCLLQNRILKADEIDKADRIAAGINLEVVELFEKKYNLTLAGTQISGPREIKLMGLMFDLKQSLDKDEARRLIVETTEEYLNKINSNIELRPYLINYPYTLENIEINIFFEKETGEIFQSPNIGLVSSFNGLVEYQKWTRKGRDYYDKAKETESFEEASKHVKNMTCNK